MSFYRTILFPGIIAACLCAPLAHAALSCSMTTAAGCAGTVILRLSAASNAHAELPSQSTAAYANNVICCTGVTALGNSCSDTFGVVLKLSAATNAHVQQNSQAGYANNACISAPPGNIITVGYQANNCAGFDTTLASMSAATNAQVADSAYATKICGTIALQSISFALSANSVSFGTLSPTAARFANTSGGSATESEAHTLTASTNASSGYAITVRGTTLTAGVFSIAAIGGTNTVSNPGTDQFGLRIVASGGNGTVTAPYDAAGFADAATASIPSQVAAATTGNGADTVYSVRYIANVAANTIAGSYSTNLVYSITANF